MENFQSLIMVGETGLEPAASWSQTRRSSQLSYSPTNGAVRRIRTGDPLLTKQLLYQLS